MNEELELMIVDDHPVFRQGLYSCLQNNFLLKKVHFANDGVEALEILKDHKVDIIFMDIIMPRMDGIEATKLIMKYHIDAKIIALSIFDDHNSIAKMVRAGASGYLTKNASVSEIVKAIRIIISGSKYFPTEIVNVLTGVNNNHDSIRNKLQIIQPLTEKETEIVKMILLGYTSNQIAEKLSISIKTVEVHRTHIFEKLNIKHVIELVYFAFEKGILKESSVKSIGAFTILHEQLYFLSYSYEELVKTLVIIS